MPDYYQQGFDGRPIDSGTPWLPPSSGDEAEYARGVHDRTWGKPAPAWALPEPEPEPEPAWASPAPTQWRGRSSVPVPEELTWADLLAGIPLTIALLAAGGAFVLGHDPLFWAAVGAGVWFAFIAVIIALTIAGMAVYGTLRVALLIARWPFVLWPWTMGLGLLGALAGLGFATMMSQPTAAARSFALLTGLVGIAAGLVAGSASRIVRVVRAHRGRRPR